MKYFYSDNLESERLITKFLTPEYSTQWAEFFKDREALEYLPDPGFPSAIERSKDWINKQLTRYSNRYFGLQALHNKKTGEFIGQCGLLFQIIDNEWEVEVGYHILKKYWGQGYAPEAAKLFIEFAFKNNLSNNIISIINIANSRSQRVAHKNGLKREKQTKWSDLAVFIYRLNK